MRLGLVGRQGGGEWICTCLRYKFKFQIPSYFSRHSESCCVGGNRYWCRPKLQSALFPFIWQSCHMYTLSDNISDILFMSYWEGVFRIDRLESLVTESLRARTDKALVKKQTEDRDSRVIIKEVLSFTLIEKGTFVREIMVQEFAKDTKEGKASVG
ncbi:hypothetical protein LWI28_004065 [Acer negundo]|uniref:Uncharacterized protein n=1 Tax=Acer negundo TaxID=4023 RepID=A0AAD5J4D1_ACENE|nr:hypothetical protein LWI28_004065 [Acer negundo]